MTMNLKDIKSPKDIKGLSIAELQDLARQMREATLYRTSNVGGHVGPNLGDPESIIAMHYVFDAPVDKLVLDVSHQDFPHKMLTGRAYGFLTPEGFKEIGEYSDPKESPEYDIFYAGHTSPSISLCVGLAKARELKGGKESIVAFIGDGAMSGGMAFEGLDAAATLKGNFVVIFNDNQMAIAPNYGGMYAKLRELRETNGTADDNLFKAFGFDYIYVRDGNNLPELIEAFKKAKASDHPIVVHINTQKGLGWAPAEKNREEWHWSVPYNIADAEPLSNPDTPDNASVLFDFLEAKIKEDPTTLVISSATPGAFGFDAKVRQEAGRQYMDVAIAEQTGVSVMAGAARGGAKPIYPVIASFLQRAYDQLMEDWAMDASPALMPVLSTGICGIPDKTHLGFWDIPMITSVPDIVYLAPTNMEELRAMLEWGHRQTSHKVAVRVPTYSVEHAKETPDESYDDINKFKVVSRGKDVAIIALGDFFVKGEAVKKLLAESGINATLINPRFCSDVDTELINELAADHKLVVTIEDGSLEGGFGGRVAVAVGPTGMKCLCFGLAKRFEDRYDVAELERKNSLIPEQIAEAVKKAL